MQVEQIEVADFVVLNKMDLLEKQGGGAEKQVRYLIPCTDDMCHRLGTASRDFAAK